MFKILIICKIAVEKNITINLIYIPLETLYQGFVEHSLNSNLHILAVKYLPVLKPIASSYHHNLASYFNGHQNIPTLTHIIQHNFTFFFCPLLSNNLASLLPLSPKFCFYFFLITNVLVRNIQKTRKF